MEMNQDIITRAGEVIKSNSNYVGGGMEGIAVLALIDENGYPTASTLTIAKSEGIDWITFCTSPDSSKAMRIGMCSHASVCLSTSNYNITLVGTAEVLTDAETKKNNWFPPMAEMWSGPEDPSFCVLRFKTERYNIFFADTESEAVGVLSSPQKEAKLKVTPGLGFKGQCSQAIKLYEEALGATIVTKILYSEANAKDLQYKQEEKDFIFYAEMVIGNHLISLGDDSEGKIDAVTNSKALPISLLIEFETAEKLEAAYNKMSKGATVVTPMGSTTYCTGYVSFIDKYGIHWDFMSGYAG